MSNTYYLFYFMPGQHESTANYAARTVLWFTTTITKCSYTAPAYLHFYVYYPTAYSTFSRYSVKQRMAADIACSFFHTSTDPVESEGVSGTNRIFL